jgi:hypothetical protein
MPNESTDRIIAGAKSLPDLIQQAEVYDPNLAESLTEKSLIGSKTAWAPLLTWSVTATASHYGIGWDAATSTMIASLLSYGVLLVVRYFTRSPIGSVLPKALTAPAS